MNSRVVGRISAWVLAVASVLLVVLYVANLPFYSGSSVGSHFAWRMEHGRMRVKCEPAIHQESFYVDINSEGMRFSPEWRMYAWDSWDVNVPLWAPLGASVLGSVWLFRISRRAQTGCRKCGYDLSGLAAGARCPECGRKEGNRQ